MSRRIAFPFLTLSDASIDATTWALSLNGAEWQPVSEFLPDWDPSCVIGLHRKIRIDPILAAQDLGLDPQDLCFSVGVRLGTGQGRFPRRIFFRECRILKDGAWETEFVIDAQGNILSSVLDIFTQITLASVSSTSGVLSPKQLEERLWTDRTCIRLEGEEPRFPIEIADISALLDDTSASSAPWYLHWSPRDWSRDFHGAMRLYLNSARADFIERVQREDPYTLQMLMADVMGQICERLIMDSDAIELFNSPEPGSLGAQASTWLRKTWPGRDITFIRSVLENRPGMFRSAFLTLAELGDK